MANQNTISFYFFRHGETDWNKRKLCQGHRDIPLNKEGRKQAAKLRSNLLQFDLQMIYSSDLKRAFETAQIIARKTIPLRPLKSLREANLGAFEGKSMTDLGQKYGQRVTDFFSGHSLPLKDLKIAEGAESPREVIERVKKSLEFIQRDCSFSRIGISTHGGALRNFLSDIKGADTGPIIIPNCVAYRVAFHKLSKIWDVLGPLN